MVTSATSSLGLDLDIEKLRAETPGCRNVIHLNNAGAALMPEPVLNAMVDYLHQEAYYGGYETARKFQDRLEGVHDSVARLIHAKRDEIALLENATRAWDMAFYSIDFKPGDRILTSVSEYAANIIPFLQMKERMGIAVETIPNDTTGQLDINALEAMLDERVKLIAITHVPTNGGLVNPAEKVGQLARKTNTLYLLDACQSIGQMPIDVQRIGCDMLSATSRKFLRGPRGAGFLYVRRDRLAQLKPAMLDLHSAEWQPGNTYKIRPDARRFETWETSYAARLGLGVAIDYALGLGLDVIQQRIQTLAHSLRKGLSDLPGVTLRDLGTTHCGIISFTIDSKSPADVVSALAEQNINLSWSPMASTPTDMHGRGLAGVIRASVHYYNTDDELAQFLAQLSKL